MGSCVKGLANGLPDQTFVVYVSPLKALSNDIQKNLAAPLAGIRSELAAQGLPDVEIRTLVRTGDSPQHERASMRKRPPHIVVTTPESLYVLLGSESGRSMLSTTRTVIVDEIHALASNKRGSHLALSLERLAALDAKRRPVRIGLSATQKPIEDVARFLAGVDADGAARDCAIVDTGHVRKRDLAIAVPSSPLEAVMSNDVWKEVYAQLAQLAQEHRTTLIFVNTRRMAERAARHLSELLGADQVMSHHGSMSKELRLQRRAAAEERRAQGAGRDRLARARHRHRRRRSRLPARLAALDRGVPAARRARQPPGRRRAEGAAVPALARRARRVHGAARCGAARGARHALDPGQAARRPRPADRRRSRGAGLAGAGAVRAVSPRFAVRRR